MDHTAPNDIKPWLENLVWFFGLVLIGLRLFKEFRGGETRREVTLTDDCVCKKDFEKFSQRNEEIHDQIFSKIGGVERGTEARLVGRLENIAIQEAASREKMHGEVGELRERASALGAKMELTNQRIVQIDGKLDRLMEKKSDR